MKRDNEADVAASMCSRFSDREPGSRRPRKRQPPPPSQGKSQPQAVSGVSLPLPKAKQSAKSTTGSGSGGTVASGSVPSGSRGEERQQLPQGSSATTADAGGFTGRYHQVRRKMVDGGKNEAATASDEKPSSPKRHIFLDFSANKLSDLKLSAGDVATPDAKVHSIDNGEYMRNGDFMPTRMQAQQEAANVLIQCKLRSNAESNVALLTMAPRANMQVGLTHETNKLMAKLHQIQPNGLSSFMFGIQVAQLALKHRPNRTSQSRIVAFVGSPVEENEEQLIRLAKQLKKSRYYVDVVLFGEVNDNQAKLQSFISTLNGTEDNSHIIVVPPGSNLSETLVQSTIIQGESSETAAMAAMAGGTGGFDFGMDANDDPELALALRVSLEEERQRAQQQAMREGAMVAAPAADAAATTPAPTPVAQTPDEPNFAAMTEEELVEYAMQLSMAQEAAAAAASKPAGSSVSEPMDVSAPSSSTTKPNAGGQEAATIIEQDNIEKIISDPEALEALIGTLPGVDPKSEAFKKAKEEKEKEKCKNEEKK